MIKRLNDFLTRIKLSFKSKYFGFIAGHAYLDDFELSLIKSLVGTTSLEIISEFENTFASLIGEGECVSYGAARMGFYDLMKVLEIGEGDEVILLGSTCAVMPNAILRTGAKPIFSDIDPNTLGSEVDSIKASLTRKTRMIVAQHSFGIPCDIKPIMELAQSKEIFLLEDCALTLGSKIAGKIVGEFGNAALFSTDHSKPLNTITGGLLYSKDKALLIKLKKSHLHAAELSSSKQNLLWQRLLLEKQYCVPHRYGRLPLLDALAAIKRKILKQQSPFLLDDAGVEVSSSYPYPSAMPTFLAQLGLIELRRWESTSAARKSLLVRLLSALKENNITTNLPKAYEDKELDIIPLRLAWSEKSGGNFRNKISGFVFIQGTWFYQPVIAANTQISDLGYVSGSCPVAETIGPDMINLPCNMEPRFFDSLVYLCLEGRK